MIKKRRIGIPHVVIFILTLALADYLFSPIFEKIVFATSKFIDKRVLRNLKEQDCAEFLLSLDKKVAFDKTEIPKGWVTENWMFNLWDKPTHLGVGLPVGRMKCGATAIIIDKENDDYKILSPYDESIGWINRS